MTNSWTLEDADLVGLDIVASRLALALRPGDAVTLSGPLGAGKTTLARALVGRLGGEDEVPSPTFALMQRYETPRLVVTHCDFYRLEPSELGELGLDDALAEGWSCPNGPSGLPAGCLRTASTSPSTRRRRQTCVASS